MKIERGIMSGPVRVRISLQSEDTNSHSIMTDYPEEFEELASGMQERGQAMLSAFMSEVKPEVKK